MPAAHSGSVVPTIPARWAPRRRSEPRTRRNGTTVPSRTPHTMSAQTGRPGAPGSNGSVGPASTSPREGPPGRDDGPGDRGEHEAPHRQRHGVAMLLAGLPEQPVHGQGDGAQQAGRRRRPGRGSCPARPAPPGPGRVSVRAIASQMRLLTSRLRPNRNHRATSTGARNTSRVPMPTFSFEIVRKYRYCTSVNAMTP